MATTRRPKLMRDVAVPWKTVPAGTILPISPYGYHWGVENVFSFPASSIDDYPDWFAWVDVCDDCGKEACTQRLCADAVLPRLRYPHDLCHGHAPKLPYSESDIICGLIAQEDLSEFNELRRLLAKVYAHRRNRDAIPLRDGDGCWYVAWDLAVVADSAERDRQHVKSVQWRTEAEAQAYSDFLRLLWGGAE